MQQFCILLLPTLGLETMGKPTLCSQKFCKKEHRWWFGISFLHFIRYFLNFYLLTPRVLSQAFSLSFLQDPSTLAVSNTAGPPGQHSACGTPSGCGRPFQICPVPHSLMLYIMTFILLWYQLYFILQHKGEIKLRLLFFCSLLIF